MPMKLDVTVKTEINGIMWDDAEPGLNGVTFSREKYTQEFKKYDPEPKTRYNSDNIYLEPGASISFAPDYTVEYAYIFLRRVATIRVTQDQGAGPVTVDIRTQLLELRGTFQSFEIVSLEATNITEGKILLIGRDIP